MTIFLKGHPIETKSARRPAFTAHGGRTWDRIEGTIDGRPVVFHQETTWASRVYFQNPTSGAWRSFSAFDLDISQGPLTFTTTKLATSS